MKTPVIVLIHPSYFRLHPCPAPRAPVRRLGIARDGESPVQGSNRHRQDDSHNSGANISANETQNNDESFCAPGLDEIIRHYERPRDTKKETQIVNPNNATPPTVCAQPPTNNPELRRPIEQRVC